MVAETAFGYKYLYPGALDIDEQACACYFSGNFNAHPMLVERL
jgi:hypothetical protein